jgi:Dimethyladenosine transferase (rRNA methylation)
MDKILIWGTGVVATRILQESTIDYDEITILGYIDNDINKQGKIFKRKSIYSSSVLGEKEFDKIVILANAYKEIEEQIKKEYPASEKKIENRYYFIKKNIIARYKNNRDNEIKEIVAFIRDRSLEVFNYNFIDKYSDMKVDVNLDEKYGLFYVYHYGKKMYFAKYLNTEEKVQEYYKNLCIEQDEASPHRYLDEKFTVRKGDIVVDAGVAEGNFSLEIVDLVEKIYIIEADFYWMEALRHTFKDYEKKVVFINKFLSNYTYGNYEILDNIVKEPVDFIKMDIEGSEYDALEGAEHVISISENVRCGICSYHYDHDEEIITRKLEQYGLNSSTTNGYMWFPLPKMQNIISTKLNRGIVRGERRNG